MCVYVYVSGIIDLHMKRMNYRLHNIFCNI